MVGFDAKRTRKGPGPGFSPANRQGVGYCPLLMMFVIKNGKRGGNRERNYLVIIITSYRELNFF